MEKSPWERISDFRRLFSTVVDPASDEAGA